MGVGSSGGSRNEAQGRFIWLVCFREVVHATRDTLGEVFRDSAHGSLSGGAQGESYICGSPLVLYFKMDMRQSSFCPLGRCDKPDSRVCLM